MLPPCRHCYKSVGGCAIVVSLRHISSMILLALASTLPSPCRRQMRGLIALQPRCPLEPPRAAPSGLEGPWLCAKRALRRGEIGWFAPGRAPPCGPIGALAIVGVRGRSGPGIPSFRDSKGRSAEFQVAGLARRTWTEACRTLHWACSGPAPRHSLVRGLSDKGGAAPADRTTLVSPSSRNGATFWRRL
jgi:hypothetical protein